MENCTVKDMFDEITFIQPLLSSVWPEWKITGLLGKGSYGAVYEISRNDLGADYKCALKVLQMYADLPALPGAAKEGPAPGRLHFSSQFEQDFPGDNAFADNGEQELADFERDVCNEIDLMIRLKGIPNIVSIEDYAVLREKGGRTIFIRMEELENVTALIQRGRCRDRSEVIRLGMDICSALEFCHQRNILHRDIKPGNIFYSEKSGFKLGDFGISRTMASVRERMSMSGVGSPRYVAPEVYSGRKYDNTVDIYSLGLTLYELLNDNYPPLYDRSLISSSGDMDRAALHSANMRRLRGESLPPPSGADDALAKAVVRACDPDPGRRFQTASGFKSALSACLNPCEGTPDPPPGNQRSIAPFLVPAAAALISIFVIFMVFIAGEKGPGGTVGYTVIYKDSALGNALSDKETATGKVGEEITRYAIDIPDYKPLHSSESIVLTENAKDNVIVFLYEEEARDTVDGSDPPAGSVLEDESLPLPDDRLAIEVFVSGISPNTINLRSESKHESDLVCSVDETVPLYFFGEIGKGEGSDHKEHEWYHVMVQPGVWGYARSDYAKKGVIDALSTGEYLYPSDTAVITERQLNSLTREEIALIRCEIFARHGYVFSGAGLQDFFKIRSWYRPDSTVDPSEFDFSVLNGYERENIEKILNYESSRGWR